MQTQGDLIKLHLAYVFHPAQYTKIFLPAVHLEHGSALASCTVALSAVHGALLVNMFTL